jgi:hypothetical protein
MSAVSRTSGSARRERSKGNPPACCGAQAPRTAIADRGPVGVAAADLVHLRRETAQPRMAALGQPAPGHPHSAAGGTASWRPTRVGRRGGRQEPFPR